MAKFRLLPDHRTPNCTHDQTDGCYHCCANCDQVEHRCGGCGKPLDHSECSGLRLGTCNECHQVYFGDGGD